MISPLHKEAVPVSVGVFLIDIDRRIRACMRYSPTTGTLRVRAIPSAHPRLIAIDKIKVEIYTRSSD